MIRESKRFFQVCYYLFITCLILVYTLSFLTTQNNLPLEMFIAVSPSMGEVMPKGSLLIVKEQSDYDQGEIITFQKNHLQRLAGGSETITHRVIETRTKNDQVEYLTRGDVNRESDGWVSKQNVTGKVVSVIPVLGKLIHWLQTKTGKLLGIYLPVALISGREMWLIIRNLKN